MDELPRKKRVRELITSSVKTNGERFGRKMATSNEAEKESPVKSERKTKQNKH